jgi:hypothetical protein
MNIVRRFPQGPAGQRKVPIRSTCTDDVLHLAGQMGYFDKKEYGIDIYNDISYNLAWPPGSRH